MGDQEFIQNIMDQMYVKLNDPTSGNYYLPNFVVANHYDPYGPFSWDLGQLTDKTLLQSADTICGTIDITAEGYCTDKAQFYITAAIPPNYPTLSMSSSFIGGLSNAVAERPIAKAPDGRVITIQIDFSTLPNLQRAIAIKGNFTFTNYCCCSNDQTTCAGPAQPQVGTGTYVATIPSVSLASQAKASAVITFKITDLAQGVLNLVVTNVQLVVPTQTGGPSMDIEVDITSIPKGANPQSYSNMAQVAFSSDQGRTTILQQINQTMNDPGTLATVSDVLTKAIDGFLRESHQYPFDKASVAIA